MAASGIGGGEQRADREEVDTSPSSSLKLYLYAIAMATPGSHSKPSALR